MKRHAGPAMTRKQFQDAIDGHAINLVDLAEFTHRSLRTIKSYYYGERPVPNEVAMIVAELAGNAQEKALDRAKKVAEPWWISMMGRFAQMAEAQLTKERNTLRDAVNAYCLSCEPEGICRTGDCPLRAVSPLEFIPIRTRAA